MFHNLTMFKKICFLFFFIAFSAFSQFDLGNKHSSLKDISSGSLGSLNGTLMYCSKEYPRDYSLVENVIEQYEQYHIELFSYLKKDSYQEARDMSLRTMPHRAESDQEYMCIQFLNDLEIYKNKNEYYEVLSASYDKMEALMKEL